MKKSVNPSKSKPINLCLLVLLIFLSHNAIAQICVDPTNIDIQNITTEGFQLSWTAEDDLYSEVEICPEGIGTGDPECIFFEQVFSPLTVSNLTGCYHDIYITNVCEDEISDTEFTFAMTSPPAPVLSLFCSDELKYPNCEFPTSYDNNQDITFIICPLSTTEIVTINFSYYDVEVSSTGGCDDWVHIKDATTGVDFGQFCSEFSGIGDSPNPAQDLALHPEFTAEGPGHCLEVNFQSGNSFRRTGFQFDVSCEDTFDACLDGYTGTNALTNLLTQSRVYITNQSVESTQSIIGNSISVDYEAGSQSTNFIELNPGFEVGSGSEFNAFFEGCDN